MISETGLNSIISIIHAAKKNNAPKSKICFFLGAGVDLSSGGKTFRQLKIDFLNKFHKQVLDDITEQRLDELFDDEINSLDDWSKSQLLADVAADNINFTDGYKTLILLASKGYIDTIITTNFFDFLEKCEEEMQLSPFRVISPGFFNIESFYKHTAIHNPLYIKVHGNARASNITHVSGTEIDSRNYPQNLLDILKYIIQTHILIFIGYSGYDNKLTESICDFFSNDTIYWIAPSGVRPDAKLVQLLDEKSTLEYCKTSFDEFVLKYACTCFSKDNLSDVHPTFIFPLIQNKICEETKHFLNTSHIIKREIYDELIEKIFDLEKDVLIYGKKGLGKTAIIEYLLIHGKNELIIPVKASVLDESILKKISNILGFDAKIPFSLLYSFCQWCNKNSITVVFIVDGLISSNQETNIRCNEELFNFIRATKEFSSTRFLISAGSSFNISSIDDSIFDMDNRYEITPFSTEEKNSYFKDSNIDLQTLPYSYQEILSIPYFCEIYSKYHLSMNSSNNFFQSLNELLLKMRPSGIAHTTLTNVLSKIAGNEIYENKKTVDSMNTVCINYLENYNMIIIDGEIPYFRFEQIKIYYVSELLYEKNEYALKDCFNIPVPQIIFDSHLYRFNLVLNVEKMSNKLKELNDMLSENPHNSKTIHFTKKALMSLITQNEYILVETIRQCGIDRYSETLKKCIFSLIKGMKDNSNICDVLDIFSKDSMFKFDSFIFRADCLYQKIKNSPEEIKTHCNIFMKKQDVTSQLLIYIYQLMFLEQDLSQSDFISKQFLYNIKQILLDLDKKEIQNYLIPVFKQYSYNILFNSSSQIEENFAAISHDSVLMEIFNTIKTDSTMTLEQYMYLLKISLDINNMFKFLFANLLVIWSGKNNIAETIDLFREIIDFLGDDILVEQLDFLISSIFMTLFEHSSYRKDVFINIFEQILSKYEMKMFEQPQNHRSSTVKKFSNEFNLIFEDGFNPLAFYFYTVSTLKNGDLIIYHKLVDILIETGHESKILKIVHALGQMISIMPIQGYVELEKVIYKTQHVVVKKGVLRILKENSIRYPEETNSFINRNKDYFSLEDKDEVFLVLDSKLENRTLEQLHWSRLFYHLGKNNSNYIRKVTTAIATSSSFNSFLEEILFQN